MRPIVSSLVLGLILVIGLDSVPESARAATPNEHLLSLAPLVGKTWRGEFTNSTPERPMVDVQRWEWALGGQAIKIRHSLNEGQYGGETFIVWDRERERLIYFYFTTAGFYTTGTIAADEGNFVTYEEVTGSRDGTTAVRSTSRILPDGRLEGTTEYLRNGEWVHGRGVVYEEAPDARVVFPPIEMPAN